MIKKQCQGLVRGLPCNRILPGTKKYNAVYGNYCDSCSGKTGYYHSKKILDSMNKTPLELETIRRLKEETDMAQGIHKHYEDISDDEYRYLGTHVAEEMNLAQREKAQSRMLEIQD